MTKEEKIKEAWGGSYGGEMDENGWKSLENAFIPGTLSVDINPSGKFYRPKSLQGIEKNNGWIKIESEDDLPKDGMTNYFICVDGVPSVHTFNLRQVFLLFEDGMLSHYQPIVKPLKPIY